MEKTYCKIVLVARMGAGIATPAFCAKRAFEKQGHTVFLFTPKMWPELFDEAGTFDAAALSRFFEVQRPDCLMLAEGIARAGLTLPSRAALPRACLSLRDPRPRRVWRSRAARLLTSR